MTGSEAKARSPPGIAIGGEDAGDDLLARPKVARHHLGEAAVADAKPHRHADRTPVTGAGHPDGARRLDRPAGIDQRSPARHPDWLGPDDLSLKVQEIREATDYRIPIQLKLGASRVYDDVRMAAKCGPDIIYLDGAEGGTGAGPHIATEETGIPLMAAIPEARRALEDVGLADPTAVYWLRPLAT